MRLGHPNYVRSVMSASQIPFSCYSPCATLSFERKLLIRMTMLTQNWDISISAPSWTGVLNYAINDDRTS